jgi:hypothetical protein
LGIGNAIVENRAVVVARLNELFRADYVSAKEVSKLSVSISSFQRPANQIGKFGASRWRGIDRDEVFLDRVAIAPQFRQSLNQLYSEVDIIEVQIHQATQGCDLVRLGGRR